MLIQCHMERVYKDFLGSDFSEDDCLKNEVNKMMVWGIRRWSQVVVPEFCDGEVLQIVHEEHGPDERRVQLRIWPLEKSNPDMLEDLDVQIVAYYRILKGLGIDRPSIVGCYAYRDALYCCDNEALFLDNRQKWAGASLVWHRLESTGRLAVRYADFDQFGPVRVESEKNVTCHFSKNILRPEMVRRGLLRGK